MFKLCISLLLAGIATIAQAQGTFPDKPIHFIFPYPAGGTGDSIMRIVADMLGPELKGSVIVENRPGASGTVGTRYVADSAPNGYTLAMTSNGTHAAVMSLFKAPGYDPVKSFTHIGLFASLPWMLVVRSEFPASSVTELVAYGRANPGKLTMPYYSSSSRLPVYLLRSAGKFQLTEVPYKGAGQILPDLYSGQLQAAFFPMEIAMAQAQGGKVRILGSASEKRLPGAPNVPTIGEQLPGVVLTSWMGMGAPAGTPKDVVAKLNAALASVVAKPAFRERLQQIGSDVLVSTPELVEARIKEEMTTWSKFVKDAGIQPE